MDNINQQRGLDPFALANTTTTTLRQLESNPVPFTLPILGRQDTARPGKDYATCPQPGSSVTPEMSSTLEDAPQPAFESVKVRCHQLIKTESMHFPSLQPPQNPIKNPVPCRVEKGRLRIEWRHFINDAKMTPLVSSSKSTVLDSIVAPLFDTTGNGLIPWDKLCISRLDTSHQHCPEHEQDQQQSLWACFRSNILPPVGPYQEERPVLRTLILDICWTSKNMRLLQSRLFRQSDNDISPLRFSPVDGARTTTTTTAMTLTAPRGIILPESMAAAKALQQVLVILRQEHPLIFSSQGTDRFLFTIRHNETLAESLCGIYERAITSEHKENMAQSFKRMQQQFPHVPRDDIRMLVKHSLESLAYKVLDKSFRDGAKAMQRVPERYASFDCSASDSSVKDSHGSEDLLDVNDSDFDFDSCDEDKDADKDERDDFGSFEGDFLEGIESIESMHETVIEESGNDELDSENGFSDFFSDLEPDRGLS
ncbi:hypothetical protein BGZ83_006657 [Gryganskiella cystojenkinii]|nr:hypothetical protein BGZ83_006657 [Gryganskiella cystojenkinii]